MKRNAILFLGLVAGFGLQAQNAVHTTSAALTTGENSVINHRNADKYTAESTITYWSEDFSAGVPPTWSNTGSSANALWEYRGANTTPNSSTGSRGAYNGGGGVVPIASPTASTGFMIFDSDYLDNNGVVGNAGGGVAPTPHVGTLTTDTIDLSTATTAQLTFYSKARQFLSDYWVAVSIDGGLTYVDTFNIHSDLGVNSNHTDAFIAVNLTDAAAGEAYVVLSFIYNGDQGSAGQEGYYYWEIDDLAITDVPEHELRFVELGDAPKYDLIYDGGTHSKYGLIQTQQAVPITFDANIYNYGSSAQTNVVYTVNIVDAATNTSVTTLTSPTLPTLAPGDTGTFNVFTTTAAWTPTAAGDYLAILTATSDSVGVVSTSLMPMDTVEITVANDAYGVDWGTVSNTTGSDASSSGEMIYMGVRYSLEVPTYDAGSGTVGIDAVVPYISSLTDPIAEIEVQIWDTTGFTFGTSGGFPVTAQPLFTKNFDLTGLVPATGGALIPLDVTTISGTDTLPLELPANTYYVVLNFIPNTTGGIVRVGNNATFNQPGGTAIMGLDNGAWYSGFLNSSSFEAPIIRLEMSNAMDIEETALEYVNVYPNPSKGNINLTLDNGGEYTFRLMNVNGQEIKSFTTTVNAGEQVSADFSDVAKGIYLLNIVSEDFATTTKITLK